MIIHITINKLIHRVPFDNTDPTQLTEAVQLISNAIDPKPKTAG